LLLLAIMRRGIPARQGERRATFVALHFQSGCLERMSMVPRVTSALLRRVFMSNRLFRMAGLFAAVLLLTAPARAQSPSPESTAAAKELIDTINLANQFKNLVPVIMKNLKPAIVQGRSNVDRDYDAMMPVLLEAFQARVGELTDALAIIYSSNFSAEELHTVTAFYKTPAGQKFLQKQPLLVQQTMTAGQKFGQSIAEDMQKRMIEELRKKGHTL
jgi:hypothetical protein